MPADLIPVLIPDGAGVVARRLSRLDCSIHTYEYRHRSLLSRVTQRAGLVTAAAWSLDRQWRADRTIPWSSIRAFWCGPAVHMSRPEAVRLLDRMPALEQVYWQRTGLDGLPTDVFEQRGVHIHNSNDLTSRWVAETTIACIASDAKFLSYASRERVPSLDHFTRGFDGLRVAVVGTGHIGSTIAQLGAALGMRITGLTRDPSRPSGHDPSFSVLRRFPEMLMETARETDYLVLALPLNADTQGLIGENLLAALGPNGVLVNLARPGLVDQSALIRALRRNTIRAAYVSRLESPRLWTPWRSRRERNLFMTFNREAHVAEKTERAARQFFDMIQKHMISD